MTDDPGGSRKALKRRATARVTTCDDDMRYTGLIRWRATVTCFVSNLTFFNTCITLGY